jgi:hypothetical protein
MVYKWPHSFDLCKGSTEFDERMRIDVGQS